VSLWERSDAGLRWTGHQPPKVERFRSAGVELSDVFG